MLNLGFLPRLGRGFSCAASPAKERVSPKRQCGALDVEVCAFCVVNLQYAFENKMAYLKFLLRSRRATICRGGSQQGRIAVLAHQMWGFFLPSLFALSWVSDPFPS